jgi:hypothetical protein
MAPKYIIIDAGNSAMPKRSHMVLPLRSQLKERKI